MRDWDVALVEEKWGLKAMLSAGEAKSVTEVRGVHLTDMG